MTPKQVSKHREAIKWFCDNPDKMVWKKDHKTNNWYLCEQPAFDYKDIYVQNDEYSEYRRALADGKTIQFYYEIHNVEPKIEGEWRDWSSYGQCFENTIKYRIKPKEPEFKVGDWVTDKQDIWQHYACADYDVEVALWKPQVGELCVFWYEIDSYYIGRYSSTVKCDTHPYKDAVGYSASGWDNIAPLEFTKTLKTLEG